MCANQEINLNNLGALCNYYGNSKCSSTKNKAFGGEHLIDQSAVATLTFVMLGVSG